MLPFDYVIMRKKCPQKLSSWFRYIDQNTWQDRFRFDPAPAHYTEPGIYDNSSSYIMAFVFVVLQSAMF